MRDNVLRKLLITANVAGLKLVEEMRGYHDRQSDLSIRAVIGDTVVGFIDYCVYRNEVSIQMISVDKQYQRQGIATIMLRKLDEIYPDIDIDAGYETDDGHKLLETYRRRYPKKVSFEDGLSNRDFVISLLPNGKYNSTHTYYDICFSLMEVGIDLHNYQMDWKPDQEQFEKDLSKLNNNDWAKVAKELRSRLGIKKNIDVKDVKYAE